MNHPTLPDLIKTTEIFLVPSSFLVAALGTADTNSHRAAVSLIALVISLLWWICAQEALADVSQDDQKTAARSWRRRVLALLPVVFIVCWACSLLVHAALWSKPLGTNLTQVSNTCMDKLLAQTTQ